MGRSLGLGLVALVLVACTAPGSPPAAPGGAPAAGPSAAVPAAPPAPERVTILYPNLGGNQTATWLAVAP